MFSRMVKNTLGLLFWSLAVLFVLAVTAATVTANYLALSYAFYLLKYDGEPITEDQFVGTIFRAFCPEATIAQFYASALAVGLAICFFLIFKEAFGTYDAWLAMRLHRADGNTDQAQAFRWEIAEKSISLVLLACSLGWVVAWDVELFRYRGAAQIAGLEEPGDAVQLITWDELRTQPSFALDATQVGTWGYIGLTAALCLVLEITTRKTRRYADRIFAEIESLDDNGGATKPSERELLGYDTAGLPVYDDGTPLTYDAEGNEFAAAEPQAHSSESGAPSAAERPEEQAGVHGAPFFVVPPVGRPERGAARHEVAREDAARPVAEPIHEQAREADGEMFTVIGTAERVMWTKALKDEGHYYCDLVNKEVWDRAAYESLHGASVPPTDEPEPMAA